MVGRRLGVCATAAYASKKYLVRRDLEDPARTRWIGFGPHGPYPKWVKESAFPNVPVKGQMVSLLLQLSACKAGMGLAMLPCFLGDAEMSLKRLSPPRPDPAYELWILTHRDMRASARIRVFSDFIAKAIISCRPQMEGLNRKG